MTDDSSDEEFENPMMLVIDDRIPADRRTRDEEARRINERLRIMLQRQLERNRTEPDGDIREFGAEA